MEMKSEHATDCRLRQVLESGKKAKTPLIGVVCLLTKGVLICVRHCIGAWGPREMVPGEMVPDTFVSPRCADYPRPPTWSMRQRLEVLAHRPSRRTYSSRNPASWASVWPVIASFRISSIAAVATSSASTARFNGNDARIWFSSSSLA
jgi:hypothetical protein